MKKRDTYSSRNRITTVATATGNQTDEAIMGTAALVQLIKSKSEQDFSVLYDKYSNALFSILFKIVKRTDVAEDLLQEVFIKIWRHIDSYDPKKGALFTWMLNIARNQAIDYLRSYGHRQQQQNVQIDLSMINLDFNSTAALYASEVEFKDMKAKTLQLEPKYAQVIDMIFFYGWTHEQTAQKLNLPIGTVKTRARKALSILKTLYQQ